MPNAELSDAVMARIERITAASKHRATEQGPTAQDARPSVQEFTERAGVKRTRIITPLQLLYQRNLLTVRQLSAGQSLVDDAETALGVDQPPDEARTSLCREPGGRMLAMIEAGNRVAKARKAAEAEHPAAWAMVKAVALEEMSVSAVTGTKKAPDRKPFLLALRVGLDAVGDSYGHTTAFVRTRVLADGVPIGSIEVTEDANGNDRDGGTRISWRARSITCRGVTLPWVSDAATMGALYHAAKVRIASWPQT
jgi:hypothetical protein